MAPKKVAIIGAGPAGLTVLREMSKDPEAFLPIAFERRTVTGGVWNYSDEVGTDKFGFPYPNSIYKHLVTNLPKQIMGYDYFPYPEDYPSFMHNTVVTKYLQDYVEKFDLKRFVKFETLVTEVKPQTDSGNLSWNVTTCDVNTEERTTSVFDAVISCNGIFQMTNIPDLEGTEDFKGVIIHTKDYRDPELYRNKDVLIIGASFSAWEIVKDLGPLANKIYGQDRPSSLIKMSSMEEVTIFGPIQKVLPDGILLESGETVKVDVIFYATGYKYHLPYISPECGVSIKNERVTPLFRHMVHIKYPTLMFISLIRRSPITHVLVLQARYACAILSGKFKLPSEEEMTRQQEEDYQKRVVARGLDDKYSHDMLGYEPFKQYADLMTTEAGLEPLAPDVFKFVGFLFVLLKKGFKHIRRYDFKLVDGEYTYELKSEWANANTDKLTE